MSGARCVPFAYGFRPFFLAAGLFAVLAIGAWAWVLLSGRATFGALPVHLWHGHETLYGFAGAELYFLPLLAFLIGRALLRERADGKPD